MRMHFLFLAALFASSAQGHDRCFVTAQSGCEGPSLYEIDLPGQATSLHEQSCAQLKVPCDSDALVGWVAVHVEAKRSLRGGITNARIRGSLLTTASRDVNADGKFVSHAGKTFALCFQAEGRRPRVLGPGACPALPRSQPCKQGTVDVKGSCLLPVTSSEVDPQTVLKTLLRATETLKKAEAQQSITGGEVSIGEGSEPAEQPKGN